MSEQTEKVRWVGPINEPEVLGHGILKDGDVVEMPVGTSNSPHWEAVAETPKARGGVD